MAGAGSPENGDDPKWFYANGDPSLGPKGLPGPAGPKWVYFTAANTPQINCPACGKILKPHVCGEEE